MNTSFIAIKKCIFSHSAKCEHVDKHNNTSISMYTVSGKKESGDWSISGITSSDTGRFFEILSIL